MLRGRASVIAVVVAIWSLGVLAAPGHSITPLHVAGTATPGAYLASTADVAMVVSGPPVRIHLAARPEPSQRDARLLLAALAVAAAAIGTRLRPRHDDDPLSRRAVGVLHNVSFAWRGPPARA
jgi:hypothetical protein